REASTDSAVFFLLHFLGSALRIASRRAAEGRHRRPPLHLDRRRHLLRPPPPHLDRRRRRHLLRPPPPHLDRRRHRLQRRPPHLDRQRRRHLLQLRPLGEL